MKDPHTLIVGMTGSGKSSLAKIMAQKAKAAGALILCLDPKNDPGFCADFSTTDPAKFQREVTRAAGEKTLVIVDESADTIGNYAGVMCRIATMNRELAHRAIFITQRGAALDKNIVLNCGNVFVFRSSGRDCKTLCDDLGKKQVYEALEFDRGEYLYIPAYGQVRRGSIFTISK